MTTYFIYGLVVIFIISFVIYIKDPRRMKKIEPMLKKIFNTILPFEWHESLNSLTKDRIKALNSSDSISSQLLLESYESIDEEIGIFNLVTGRIGIGFEISAPTCLGEDTLKGIKSAFFAIDIKDVAVQFITYASSDIVRYVNAIGEVCSCNTKVGNSQGLLKMRDDRIKKTKKWSKSTMLSESSGADLRARNFINLAIIVFPDGTPINKIKSLYYTIKGALQDLNPKGLSPDQVAKFYGEILKEDSSLSDYDIHKKMNTQLAKGSHIKINDEDGFIAIGKKTYAKVLTTIKYPRSTTLTDMTNAFFSLDGSDFQIPFPSPFMVSMTIHIDNPEKLKNKILSKARANVSGSEKTQRKTAILNPKLGEWVEESLRTIDYIEKYDQKPYQAMYSITVFDDNKDRLNTAIGRFKARAESVNEGGWKVQEEQMGTIALQTLLWSMPFQFDNEVKEKLDRSDLLFTQNMMSILPLFSSFKGIGNPVLRFFARTGQVVGIDFWASDNNYNVCVIGPSGSGKSFLSNSIQASHLQAGVKITIFDKGKSYLPLCQELKGEFISFEEFTDEGKPNKKCLNFFTNLITKTVHKDDFRTDKILMNYVSFSVDELAGIDGTIEIIDEDFFQPIIIIIGIMCGQDFTPGINEKHGTIDNANKATMKIILSEAVKTAFFRRGREAGMREVAEALELFKEEAVSRKELQIAEAIHKILFSLSPYSNVGGEFYSYFNSPCNINIENDLCLLELDELTRKGDLYDLVVMFMLERCIADMYLDRSKKKSIVIDEAAMVLRNPIFANYLEDFARRVRKYNGSLMTITQEAEDYTANPSAKAVWTNASHKFILSLDPASVARGFTDGGLFLGWSDFMKFQMLSVKNRVPEYSEVMYVYGGRFSEVLLLKVTHQEAALFTTKASEITEKKELQKQYNLTPQDATSMFAYLREGLPVHEILNILKEGDRSGNIEYWIAKIRNALNKNTITPFSQPIFDKEGNIVFYETYLRILDGDDIYTPKDFLEAAIDQEYLKMIQQIHLQKCMDFYVSRSMPFSINLHKSEIGSHLLNDLDQMFGENKGLLILEVSSKDIDEKDVFEFCLEAKQRGYILALDNIGFDINLGLLDQISPNLIKINGELIRVAIKDESKKLKLKVICDLARALNTKSSANHIERRDILSMVEEFNVDYYQGNFFAMPMDIYENFKVQESKARD